MLKDIKNLIDKYLYPNQSSYATYLYYFKNKVQNQEFIPLYKQTYEIYEWIKTLNGDFDIVIGIARYGLFVSALVSEYFNKPMSTPEMFARGEIWKASHFDKKQDISKFKKVLLVDDSAGIGKQLLRAKQLIKSARPDMEIKIGVPYLMRVPYQPQIKQTPDITYRIGNFIFELDLVSDNFRIGTDLDGVICREPNTANDLGIEYKNAIPYRIPDKTLDFIATGRSETYRATTEKWLKDHKVKYKELIMKVMGENGVDVKVRAIRQYKPAYFIESSPAESKIINLKTNCRVLCLENMYFYGGINR